MILAIPIVVCVYTFLFSKKSKEPEIRFGLYTPNDGRDSIRVYKNLLNEDEGSMIHESEFQKTQSTKL